MNSPFPRVFLESKGHIADANAKILHPADCGSWIWHPNKPVRQTSILRFRLKVHLKEVVRTLLHVTADQRFQLRCDGRDVTFGPDRCDLDHWTVQTVRFELAAGEHELEALVWWIGGCNWEGAAAAPGIIEKYPGVNPPMAQVTWCGGFLVCADNVDAALLNTGAAPWMVEDLTEAVGMEMPVIRQYIDIGPLFSFDLSKWEKQGGKPAIVVLGPVQTEPPTGVRRPGRCLYPASILEQRRESWTGGRIRAIRQDLEETPFLAEHESAPEIAAWQKLVSDGQPVTIPAQSTYTVLWDFDTYLCGYPVMKTLGGAGAVVEWGWAESLYEECHAAKVTHQTQKGNRNEIRGKVFVGLNDRWLMDGKSHEQIPVLWWRSGRYLRLRIQTKDEPLTIAYAGVLTTGYPLDAEGEWRSSDPMWDRTVSFLQHAFRCDAHETWTDTPYYEQMAYVGDNIICALYNFAFVRDVRLSRRAVQLFDWSRRASGLVALRYPSGWRQEGIPQMFLWLTMVRDYAWWQADAKFSKSLLAGMRGGVAEIEAITQSNGLLSVAPGWPVVDWVPEWGDDYGCGPGMRQGDSSILNLEWVLGLQAVAQMEEAYGDPVLANRATQLAQKTFDAVVERYWDPARGLFLQTHGQADACEHSQALALLTGLLDKEKTKGCIAALEKGEGLSKTAIYFSFYVLEALYVHGREAEFYRRLRFWEDLLDRGFKSTPESPEPCRSDAHAYTAHPAWHTMASIAGVRPAAKEFSRVRIAPMPGPLERFEAKIVHPRGFIEVHFRREAGQFWFQVTLPEGITGVLEFQDNIFELVPGRNEINGKK